MLLYIILGSYVKGTYVSLTAQGNASAMFLLPKMYKVWVVSKDKMFIPNAVNIDHLVKKWRDIPTL